MSYYDRKLQVFTPEEALEYERRNAHGSEMELLWSGHMHVEGGEDGTLLVSMIVYRSTSAPVDDMDAMISTRFATFVGNVPQVGGIIETHFDRGEGSS